MRIFLDPGYRDECTVWFDNGNIQTLRGNIYDICIKIRNYVIDNFEDEDGNVVRRIQTKNVFLDTMGIGASYADCLNSMNVKFDKCTYNKLIS